MLIEVHFGSYPYFRILHFFSIKLFNLHYTNKQRTYNTKIKNIYKKITTHVLNLMNYFKVIRFKIKTNTK